VPATIISRCQRFDFRKASPEEVAGRLRWLAGREKIKVSEPAILAVARRADGAIRDGESILEQLATYRPEGIELADVEELLGLVPAEQFFSWFDLLLSGDGGKLLENIEQLLGQGHDLAEFYSGLVNHARNLLLVQSAGSAAGLGLTKDEQDAVNRQAARLDRAALLGIVESLLAAEEDLKFSQLPRVVFEHLSLELAAEFSGKAVDPPAPAPARKASAPAGDPPAPPDLETLWQELLLKLNARKPMVASFVDQCRPESFAGGVLTICLTQANAPVQDKLKIEEKLIEQVLSSVTGVQAKLKVAVRKDDRECDPLTSRVKRIMGDVEEQRR